MGRCITLTRTLCCGILPCVTRGMVRLERRARLQHAAARNIHDRTKAWAYIRSSFARHQRTDVLRGYGTAGSGRDRVACNVRPIYERRPACGGVVPYPPVPPFTPKHSRSPDIGHRGERGSGRMEASSPSLSCGRGFYGCHGCHGLWSSVTSWRPPGSRSLPVASSLLRAIPRRRLSMGSCAVLIWTEMAPHGGGWLHCARGRLDKPRLHIEILRKTRAASIQMNAESPDDLPPFMGRCGQRAPVGGGCRGDRLVRQRALELVLVV